MTQYKSNSELKNLAKEKLTGNFSSALCSLLVVDILTRAITTFVSSLLPTGSMVWGVLSILLSAVVSAFLGIFETGIAYYFLNMTCHRNFTISDVYYGFKSQSEKSLKVSAVFAIADTICMLPYQICTLLFLYTRDTNYIWGMLLFMTVGYLVLIPIRLAISQSYYLLLDFPDAAAKDAVLTSMKVMKKNKLRLFLLDLSFLPLMILCLFSLGIGFLWLNPYMRMSYTLFFLDLMNPDVQNSDGQTV